MGVSTVRAHFIDLATGVKWDPTTVKLSSQDTKYGVKRNDKDEVVVNDNTTMTKITTGIYEYSWTDPAGGLTYTASFEWVHDGETFWAEKTVDGSRGTTGVVYSANSIAEMIRASLAQDPNALGNAIPDRVLSLVRQAGLELWMAWDWSFRRKQGELAFVAGTATVQLPLDFSEMDQQWLAEKDFDAAHALRFTHNVRAFQGIANRYDPESASERGSPQIALVERDTDTATAWRWRVRAAPVPDAAYEYKYWYVQADPWTSENLSDNAEPIWPATFHEGWRLNAQWRCEQAFRGDDMWKDTKKAYKDWLEKQKAENDETIAASDEPISGNYGDRPNQGSRALGAGGAIWL